MQMLLGILIGVAGLIVFAAMGMLLFYLRQASLHLKRAAEVFARMAELANGIAAQVIATKQMIAAVEQMTAVIRAFNGLVLKGGDGVDEMPREQVERAASRQAWGRTPPPPPVPSYDEFAGDGEAGILSQTDEEQADLDLARLAREQGMDTGLEMTEIPPLSEMHQVEE